MPKDSAGLLYQLCLSGLKDRQKYFAVPKKLYVQRMKTEYQLITNLNYADYFLTIWDVVEWAKKQGIIVGPARGSAAGSLVAYLIGIIDVDPLKFDLMFERFMNPVRAQFDPPDIDLDFQASRRDEVRDYIVRRYGSDRVCQIGSHSRAFASGAIRDVAKVMKLDFHELNLAVAGKLSLVTLEEAYKEVDSFREWIEKSSEHIKCYEIAKGLEGLVRYRSIHPSGMIVTPGKVEQYIPTIIVKGVKVTQWKDTWVKKRGILKLDILGLNTLDIIGKAMDFAKTDINPLQLPLEDPDVLELFNSGQTTGIFQFDAQWQKGVIAELGASSFDHIVLASAISRPGSSRMGVTESVIRRKNGEEDVEYPHEMLEDLLEDTYGYPIYQEQLMKMANIVGGIPLVDTEIMRDAISKKRVDVMSSYKDRFTAGAVQNGASKRRAGEMWGLIQAASGYGFNQAHATAYSLISFWCGYLKVHYPLEFMTACLACESDTGKAAQLVGESRRLGLNIRPAHVNKSGMAYTIDNGSIRAGLTAIKNVGPKAAQEIVSRAPYASLEDFKSKVSGRTGNKRIAESLQAAGAFGHPIVAMDSLKYYGYILGKSKGTVKMRDLANCDLCELCKNREQVVKGSGNSKADLMFVGEAPGRDENWQGRPFVGRAGKRLRGDWLRYLGLKSEDVWITNVVKCIPFRPTEKIGHPTDEQIQACSVWLDREMDLVKPKIIVALGSTALAAISIERGILAMNGKTFEVVTPWGAKGALGFALVHPAYTLYQPFDVDPALENLIEVMAEVR